MMMMFHFRLMVEDCCGNPLMLCVCVGRCEVNTIGSEEDGCLLKVRVTCVEYKRRYRDRCESVHNTYGMTTSKYVCSRTRKEKGIAIQGNGTLYIPRPSRYPHDIMEGEGVKEERRRMG